jgi:hypothetical protein
VVDEGGVGGFGKGPEGGGYEALGELLLRRGDVSLLGGCCANDGVSNARARSLTTEDLLVGNN